MFISIDIQVISVKRVLDHCTSLIGKVRHNNFQSKLMYFTGNNTTWIKKFIFCIQTLHHAFYYQCLIWNIVIIFNLFDIRFNPLKHLKDLNRKSVVYIFRRNKSISIRIFKNVRNMVHHFQLARQHMEYIFFYFPRHCTESCDTSLKLLHVSCSQVRQKNYIQITCISM
jgi:hypothetical protein